MSLLPKVSGEEHKLTLTRSRTLTRSEDARWDRRPFAYRKGIRICATASLSRCKIWRDVGGPTVRYCICFPRNVFCIARSRPDRVGRYASLTGDFWPAGAGIDARSIEPCRSVGRCCRQQPPAVCSELERRRRSLFVVVVVVRDFWVTCLTCLLSLTFIVSQNA